MNKTISISLKKIIPSIFSFVALLPVAHSEKVNSTALKVPVDSFFVLSLKLDSILTKSKINTSRVWQPLQDSWNLTSPKFKNFLLKPNETGLNSKIPLQVFFRTSNSSNNSLSFGILSQVKNVQIIDQTINNLAESLDFKRKENNKNRFRKDGFPMEFGRKNRIFYLVGFGPLSNKTNVSGDELDKLYQAIPDKPSEERLPSSLKEHFQINSDVTIYLDGSGFANITEKSWPDDQWKKLLPMLDPLFSKQFGFYMQANPGSIKLTSREFKNEKKISQLPIHKQVMLDFLPGDAPLVAKLSLPSKLTIKTISSTIDQVLRTLSNNQITKDTKLPGFDASPAELLSFPNGEFVFSGGNFSEKSNFQANGKTPSSLRPTLTMGIGVENKIGLKQLIAGLNSSNSLRSILGFNDVHITNHGESFWLSSLEYLREVRNKKPIKPLSNKRKKFLNQYLFALDWNINLSNQSIRQNQSLSFDQLKILNLMDDFKNLSIHEQNNSLISILKLNDSNRSGWDVVFHFFGQYLVDQANQNIFQAIAQDNLNSTIQAVQSGALLNATDRFGHSPLHYAAYKGNPRIVDYLLRNGGNPNTKGRHESTPLHSAAWGRNLQVLELLLEDGANVNARTDEGETPCMTAALRGEKEMLEILFALSADPHAKDIHGTNLLDLAAAGGHQAIVELLKEIGVKNQNPLHVAAGLGDLKEIKRLLKNGKPVNKQDAFGATPLLVAMVSGKEEIVDFLLSQNADPLIAAKDGYTIMHGAAFSGKKKLVQKALSFDLDVNSRYGPDGITPVDVAEETGDALPFLRALGGKTAWELGRVYNQSP